MSKASTYRVEIDFVAADGTAEATLEAMAEGFKADVKLVTESGPTGWPVAEVSGGKINVRAFLRAYRYDLDAHKLELVS
jgi:hypothetical protein